MFFTVEWHFDRGKKGKQKEMRAVVRASGEVAAVFMLALLSLCLATFYPVRMLGMKM